MTRRKSDLGLYVKMFEHKFKAKYNRAKARQLQNRLDTIDTVWDATLDDELDEYTGTRSFSRADKYMYY